MKCTSCVLVVRELLLALGLMPRRVELGEVEVAAAAGTIKWAQLQAQLATEGLELMHPLSHQERLATQIKQTIAELLRTTPHLLRSGRSSRELSRRLKRKFAYLSDIFSAVEGETLEQYIITQRIALAEQLLVSSSLTVGQIAQQLGYSSLGHLSRQFRSVKGLSPTQYRRQLPADPVAEEPAG